MYGDKSGVKSFSTARINSELTMTIYFSNSHRLKYSIKEEQKEDGEIVCLALFISEHKEGKNTASYHF